MAENKKYDWKFRSLGGITRVSLEKGEDIAHLGELDKKLWTVLSCPTNGLKFDTQTLALLDQDGDGKIRVPEVVSAADWITSLIKDKDLILNGDSSLCLDQINTDTEEGQKLYNSSKRILKSLGLEKNDISLEEASDSATIFNDTRYNGDGVITPKSSDDPFISKVIEDISNTMGSVADRSGKDGINAEKSESFFEACKAFKAWKELGEANKKVIFPYEENTADALAACEALDSKMKDYFIRCDLIKFNGAYSEAVDVSADKVNSISNKNLSEHIEEISQYPLAHPTNDAIMPFNGINPGWQDAFNKIKTTVFDIDFAGKNGISKSDWNETMAKFDAFKSWNAAKKGEIVETLGIDRISEILDSKAEVSIKELIEKDLSTKEEFDDITNVCKLLRLHRDFFRFLCNFVTFSDFYTTHPHIHAMFEAGRLYIDQRCCKLCIKVEDMAGHTDMPVLSGMFLIYCHCSSRKLGKSMDIVAMLTAGNTIGLRPGKNALFYDIEGNDWDAVVTKIIENPICIKQAFFSPYLKFWEFCKGLIDKSAKEKESKAIADLQNNLTETIKAPADTAGKPAPFDIAKFAGIFAAIGMAIGYIGSFFTKLISGVANTPIWITLLILLGAMLCISGPSCFIAWTKLRKRNLGPVLNANGWAINSEVLINILFGTKLTSTAKYPILRNTNDPYEIKQRKGLKIFIAVFIVLAGIFAALFFTDNLKSSGLSFHKDKAPAVEVVIE